MLAASPLPEPVAVIGEEECVSDGGGTAATCAATCKVVGVVVGWTRGRRRRRSYQ